jgi:hypothetical protein
MAAAVGQDENPLSAVGRSDIGRSDTTPFRIEPERGQVPEYFTKDLSRFD